MLPVSAAASQNLSILNPSPEPQSSTVSPDLLRQVINIANQPEKEVRKQTYEFLNSGKSTPVSNAIIRTATDTFMKTGWWITNSRELARENIDAEPGTSALIRDVKELEKNISQRFKDHFAGALDSASVVSRGAIAPKITGILSAKERKAAQAVRSILINAVPGWIENKKAHEQHVGSRQTIPLPAKNTSDARLFNHIDLEKQIYIDEKGKAFRVVGLKENMTPVEIKALNQAKKEYDDTISSLLKNDHSPSAAVQFNQLAYAHTPEFRIARDRDPKIAAAIKKEINDVADIEEQSDAAIKKEESNFAADTSFYYSVLRLGEIAYAPDDLLNKLKEDKFFEIVKLPVTAKDKIEMILARLTVTGGEYPSAAVAKYTMRMLSVEIPESVSELAQSITPEDHAVPYYTLFKDDEPDRSVP